MTKSCSLSTFDLSCIIMNNSKLFYHTCSKCRNITTIYFVRMRDNLHYFVSRETFCTDADCLGGTTSTRAQYPGTFCTPTPVGSYWLIKPVSGKPVRRKTCFIQEHLWWETIILGYRSSHAVFFNCPSATSG